MKDIRMVLLFIFLLAVAVILFRSRELSLVSDANHMIDRYSAVRSVLTKYEGEVWLITIGDDSEMIKIENGKIVVVQESVYDHYIYVSKRAVDRIENGVTRIDIIKMFFSGDIRSDQKFRLLRDGMELYNEIRKEGKT